MYMDVQLLSQITADCAILCCAVLYPAPFTNKMSGFNSFYML